MPTLSSDRSPRGASGVSGERAAHPVLPLPAERMEEFRAAAQTMAATDPVFREALLSDPRGALSELIKLNTHGVHELPEEIHVSVVQDGPGTAYVVIPSSDKATASQSELAKLSQEAAIDPEFRAALLSSTYKALKDFPMDPDGHLATVVNGPKVVEVVFEDPAQLLVWVPS